MRSTQRMPFSTSLGSHHGLPLPSVRRGGSGISDSNTFHCSSIRSTVLATSSRSFSGFLEGTIVGYRNPYLENHLFRYLSCKKIG